MTVLYFWRNWEDIICLDSLRYNMDISLGFMVHSKAIILKEVELIQNLCDVFYEFHGLSLFLLALILATWGSSINMETCGLGVDHLCILCEKWLKQAPGTTILSHRLHLQYSETVLSLACILDPLGSFINDWWLGSLLWDSDLIGLEITLGIRTCITPSGDFSVVQGSWEAVGEKVTEGWGI